MPLMNVRTGPSGLPAPSSKIEGVDTRLGWRELRLSNSLFNWIKRMWIIFRCQQGEDAPRLSEDPLERPSHGYKLESPQPQLPGVMHGPHLGQLGHQEAPSHPASPSEQVQVAHCSTARYRGDGGVASPPSGHTREVTCSTPGIDLCYLSVCVCTFILCDKKSLARYLK